MNTAMPTPCPRGEPTVSQPQKKETFSEATLAKVKELQSELDSIWAEINPRLAQTKDLRAKRKKLSEQVSCLKDDRVPMEAKLKSLGLDSDSKAMEELSKLQASHAEVWAKINPILAATKPKRLERDRLRREIQSLAKRIPSIQDREPKLRLMARKGECESKLRPIMNELHEAQKELTPLFDRQKELQDKIKAAQKAIFDLEAREKELTKLRDEFAPVQKELGPLFDRQKEVQEKLDALDPTRVYRRWSQRSGKREDKSGDEERRNAQLVRLYSQPKNGGSHRKRNLDLKARTEERVIRESSATPGEARERIRELRRSRRRSRPKKDNGGGKKKGKGK